MTTTPKPVILIVEDERALASAYAKRLADEYDVRVAHNGADALGQLDDDVEVVLLDRRLPGLSGDVVLGTIRERNHSCRIAMVSAVDPDFDIIDMGFDDYLVKPITRHELNATVRRLLDQARYESDIREYFSLARKKAILEEELSMVTLRSNPKYRSLDRRMASLKSNLESALDEFDDTNYRIACRDLSITA